MKKLLVVGMACALALTMGTTAFAGVHGRMEAPSCCVCRDEDGDGRCDDCGRVCRQEERRDDGCVRRPGRGCGHHGRGGRHGGYCR